MDSYFKAAVSDLDKLLDEFEENTDELENSKTVNTHDPKHHLLSSELDYQQPVFLGPYVQGNIRYTVSDELSLSTQTANIANFEQLNSEQNEKNVTGLDLLSMVDGSSDKSLSSCLGRCIVPVCDLISDTGNLSHPKNNSEFIQKLQLSDSQSSPSLIGFDLASVPNVASSSSADLGSQQQSDEDTLLYSITYNALEEQNKVTLETGSPEASVIDSGASQEKTEALSNNEVFEEVIGLERISALITHVTSTVPSSKDERKYEELPCEPVRNENSVESQENHQAISNEEKIESLVSSIPKICPLNESSATLPKEKNSSGSSLQTKNVLVLDKIYSTEEELCNPESSSTTFSVVSAPEASEDIQSSLSCLPLAVSICGKLVMTDDRNGKTPVGQAADVISGITVATEKCKNDLSKEELFGIQESSEQDENLNSTSQSSLAKPSFTDSEKVGFDNIAIECGPVQPRENAAVSGSSAEDIERCSSYLLSDIGERGLIDLALEEDIIGSDILISDAELDAFLSEHCCEEKHSKPLKEDTDDGLLESDVINDSVRDSNKLNVESEHLPAEIEFENVDTSINNNCILSNLESSLGIPVEKTSQWKDLKTQNQDTVEKSEETADHVCESKASDLTKSQQMTHSGGARPKRLLNLPPPAICTEFSSPHVIVSESQVASSTVSNTSLSDAKSSPDSVVKCNDVDTESCFKDKEDSVSPVITEPTTGVEQVITLGQKQPSWVPDSEAPNCMNCQAKFTFTKRRHHCRACGKVFCTSCCNRKCKLQYLDKEARVCVGCYEFINKAQALERMMSPTGPVPHSAISESPTIPVLQEAQASGLYPKEQRRVWFADGILPNGEVADTTKLSSGVRRSQQEPYPVESATNGTTCTAEKMPKEETCATGRTEILCCPTSVLPEEDTQPPKDESQLSCSSDCVITAVAEIPTVVEPTKHPAAVTNNENNDLPVSPLDYQVLCGIENHVSKNISLIPEDGLPPLLLARGEEDKESLVEEHPSHEEVTFLLEESNPLTFILNANLLVNVKIVSYHSERCWYFSTNGLHGLGQAEIIILLLSLPNEDGIPKEIFQLFISIYKDAMKGRFIRNLENITFTEGFLGSKEHGGFLFVTPTFQKLDDLKLPKKPFICGILIQKQEVPWAKVFPIRLMLRLGAEYGVYPTPLTSIRHRKPLFWEIGHTLMNLLVDLRNYQYTLLTIDNLVIHMEMGRSCVKIPLKRYNEVMKIMNTSNEHVISIGASFSSEADSHLVCVQNDDGVYQTQANSATGEPRKITGASFVVFNGSLKTSSGFLAKSSIVEDGIMVQITPEMMDGLRQALREKKDFRITCGKVDSEELREYVDICWVDIEEKTNVSVTSPVDGKSMEGVQSEKIVQEEYFEMDEKCIRCTEVFYLLKTSELSSHAHQFAKEIALASCTAFRPHLKTLKSNGMNKIGLRVSMDTDMVEYQAGSEGQLLPQRYLNDLDSALIPVIHGGPSNATDLPLKIELIFFITESLVV
nr:zinc finger FYVE domain-containing protein 16 isoform X1 [Pogona vitticeps]XP_020645903.1 zinc finger FYVE domain-containing protein 16 isoform X1 [Pogona vitticeps]